MNKFYREPTHDEIAELAYALSEELADRFYRDNLSKITWHEECDVRFWIVAEKWLNRDEYTIKVTKGRSMENVFDVCGGNILKGMVIYNKETF